MTAQGTKSQPITISADDVENEIARLFGDPAQSGLVIRVQGGEDSVDGRSAAFHDLLESLRLYDFQKSEQELRVAPPDNDTIASALAVLARTRLKRRLFERVLLTFGKRIVEPLGRILDTTPGGALFGRMGQIRDNLLGWIQDLKLTHETQEILTEDLHKLLSDDYLAMLAEHEENVQRPRVTELAQQILHLIGVTFDHAFRQWPHHAKTIADSISRRMGSSMSLRESPVVIRERIIDGIDEFLWIETSTELSGALAQLFAQPQYQGLLGDQVPALQRPTYRKFAEACWEIIAENC
ncbi:MAG: hypothetical protein MJE77_32255 [Proteobacteria bacterium]|nr:hypothetical protein [Pseudomonadota bacterium]